MSEIKCPKCGSGQIHADKRGFKAGRAIAGTLIAGPLAGAATGAVGKNKIIITCLACGHQFKPGEGNNSVGSTSSSSSYSETPSGYPDGVAYIKQERANYKCSHCGKVSSFDEMNKRCPACGAYIRESDRIGYVKQSSPTKNANNESNNLPAGVVILVIVLFIFLIIMIAKCS